MVFREVSWIRRQNEKLCPQLKQEALKWYRPLKHVPCFLQRPFKYMKQRWRKIPIIVQTGPVRDIHASITGLAAATGCRTQRELPLVGSFSARVNAKSLESLSKHPQVKKIWYDREVQAVLDVASPAVQAPPLWDSGVTGKGVTVAVLDTGIYDHPDLSGRITGFKDFVKRRTTPYDDNGHGTHVAGDVAANGSLSELRFRGPACEANLVGVKVLDKNGSGQLSTVIEGIQWCIENMEILGIRVLNISLGSATTESYLDDPACQAVEKAWQAGIVVCVAAGNDGPQPKTISSPGNDPLVITVGALDDNNTVPMEDDQVAGFSSRGPTVDGLVKPDVLAPGVNIISLRAPGSQLDKENRDSRVGSWYTALSGTSMATPVCSGVAAQLLQLEGRLTPDEIKKRLTEEARTLNLEPNTQGSGLIDAQRAAGAGAEGGNSLESELV